MEVNQPLLRLHLLGEFQPGQIEVVWVESSRPRIDEVEAAIAAAWEEQVHRRGINLFDGPMCRLEQWQIRDGGLRLSLSRTSYREFLGTNLCHPDFAARYGRSVLANSVGASCALQSSDGMLLLGRRNHRVAYYPGRIHPFAGALEPRGGLDVFAEARRELFEELHLLESDLDRCTCVGIIEDLALGQPELIFYVSSTLTADQIAQRLDQAEHNGLITTAAEESALDLLLQEELLTPVGVGTILLWGKNRFGSEWFDRRRSRLIIETPGLDDAWQAAPHRSAGHIRGGGPSAGPSIPNR